MNPLAPFLARQGVVVLDGGLATRLEAHGLDLNDPLWSARAILEAPDLVRLVHREYLEAGADCIVTATYQASFEGFRQRGLAEAESEAAFQLAVRIALEARDEFWGDPPNRRRRLRPLVAGSVGPYGAYLADGSEYVGDYGLGVDELVAFHRRRWQALAESGVDLLACETIPSMVEATALLRLLEERPAPWAWISFQCRDGRRLADGTELVDAVAACDEAPRVAAIGVNCVPPDRVLPLLSIARSGTGKPLAAYPNSGESYDAISRTWLPGGEGLDVANEVLRWRKAGATVMGGCCRTGPRTIARMRRTLLGACPSDSAGRVGSDTASRSRRRDDA